jgi:hypothetical protein
MVIRTRFSLLAAMLALVAAVGAEPLSVRAVMSPKEQIRADLPTPQPHFVLFVKREGSAAGLGVLNGAQLTEYGMHEHPPRGRRLPAWGT